MGCRSDGPFLLFHLFFPLEAIEVGLAILSVTEETYANAFPMTVVHFERLTGREESATVLAVKELVGVLEAVVPDTQIQFSKTTFLDQHTLPFRLHDDATRRDANAPEFLARASQTSKTIATGFHQCSALTNIAH